MAIGVGSSRILGRVHLADLQVIEPDGKKHTLQCSFTVLEDNKVDLLFGLDNLKRHQCCIDMVDWRLHFSRSEFSVPFLSDGQITAKQLGVSPQTSEGTVNESAVKELCDMGFTRQ